MSDAHEFGRCRTVDLSRLNDAERRVLRMLAEGHTTKSIATATGATPAAINERLREARRKTEVGSSRELARLLSAQENRHEQIGVARATPSSAVFSPIDAEPWRPQTGVMAMAAFLLVAATAAAVLMGQAPSGTNEVDPLIGSRLERFPQPADLHAKVRAEARDDRWAPQMEAAIRGRLLQMPLVGKGHDVLRVTCAKTICEIAGTLNPPSKEVMNDPKSLYSQTVQALQVPPLPDDLAKLGLKNEGASFFSAKGKPDRAVYLLYYSRK